jgi:hypothetical protein
MWMDGWMDGWMQTESQTDRQAGRQAGMMKLVVAFLNFMNLPKILCIKVT